jgi:hypothetical protein
MGHAALGYEVPASTRIECSSSGTDCCTASMPFAKGTIRSVMNSGCE